MRIIFLPDKEFDVGYAIRWDEGDSTFHRVAPVKTKELDVFTEYGSSCGNAPTLEQARDVAYYDFMEMQP